MYECAHWDKFIKTKNKRKKRNAKKVLFCNLPWNMAVKNNIGKEFLSLIDMFKNSPQGKYINRHTVKLSYSTMPNLKSHIIKPFICFRNFSNLGNFSNFDKFYCFFLF